MTGQHTSADDSQPRPAREPGPEDRGSGGRKSRLTWRTQALIGLMCAVLGFALVAQLRQTQEDEFATMRQDDLVRLLDEVTQRNEDLSAERDQLLRDRSGLRSGSDAQRLAEEYQLALGVLAGTEPVEGRGIVVSISDAQDVRAQTLVHMLEELRNAGAEAMELSGRRLTASSAFVDTDEGVAVDGVVLENDLEWRAIGDPQTMAVALDIPGGALAGFRNVGAVVQVEQRDLVQITPIREVTEPRYAVPTEPED